jgi:DNA primase
MSDPVLDLLNTKNLAFTVSGRDYLIKCLNPEHDDSSPSFRIDKVTGVAHCFSCGFKTNIFKHFGILTNHTSIKVAKLKQKLAQVKVAFDGLELPDGATVYSKMYRGISVNTLKHFGAFTTYQEEKLIDRIVFPIRDIRDKISVFVGRHMLSNGNPRYVNYPVNTEMPLYPVKYKGTFKSAVLVEGLFDMLNLYDRGLTNVTCCFGTNTLQKDTSLKLLPLKTQGITHIYLLFDGDKAGNDAADKLKPMIEELDFIVEIIRLPDDMDPGDMDDEYVNSIKEYVNQ